MKLWKKGKREAGEISRTPHSRISNPQDVNVRLSCILLTEPLSANGHSLQKLGEELLSQVADYVQEQYQGNNSRVTTGQITIHLTMTPETFTASATLATTLGTPLMILTRTKHI